MAKNDREKIESALGELEATTAAAQAVDLGLLRAAIGAVVRANLTAKPRKLFADDVAGKIVELAQARGDLSDIAEAAIALALEKTVGNGLWNHDAYVRVQTEETVDTNNNLATVDFLIIAPKDHTPQHSAVTVN